MMITLETDAGEFACSLDAREFMSALSSVRHSKSIGISGPSNFKHCHTTVKYSAEKPTPLSYCFWSELSFFAALGRKVTIRF